MGLKRYTVKYFWYTWYMFTEKNVKHGRNVVKIFGCAQSFPTIEHIFKTWYKRKKTK